MVGCFTIDVLAAGFVGCGWLFCCCYCGLVLLAVC